jgi:uncharacterized protein (TIGR02598 family)
MRPKTSSRSLIVNDTSSFSLNRPPGSGRFLKRGFSLVEVVIAVGIISFSLIALMGLLPVGLKTLQESTDTTTQATVFQNIVMEAQQIDFSTLTNSALTNRFYDAEGHELGYYPTSYIYHATVFAPSNTYIPAYPSPLISTNLKTLKVEITNITNPKKTNTFSAVLGNNGY